MPRLLAHEGERRRRYVGGKNHATVFRDLVSSDLRDERAQLLCALNVVEAHGARAPVVLLLGKPYFVVGVARSRLNAGLHLDFDRSGDGYGLVVGKRVLVGHQREMGVLHAEESVSRHLNSPP